MKAETAQVGPKQDIREFHSDDKLIAFGVKGQRMRLFDVFFIGPLMAFGGWKLRKEHPVLGPILALLGITTVVYNGRNYLTVKDSKKFLEFNPSLFFRKSISFQRNKPPFRRGSGPKLNVVIPKFSWLNAIGLSKRSSLPSQLGFVFGPKPTECPRPELRTSFTMKETMIPLDIAFLNKCGQIIEIRKMPRPGSYALVTPPPKTVWAIEANSGWFQVNNVKVGDIALGTAISTCQGDGFDFERSRCG